jgi:hypothetical protein
MQGFPGFPKGTWTLHFMNKSPLANIRAHKSKTIKDRDLKSWIFTCQYPNFLNWHGITQQLTLEVLKSHAEPLLERCVGGVTPPPKTPCQQNEGFCRLIKFDLPGCLFTTALITSLSNNEYLTHMHVSHIALCMTVCLMFIDGLKIAWHRVN